MSVFSRIFGDANKRTLQKLEPLVRSVNEREKAFSALSDDALKAKTQEFRTSLTSGTSIDELRAEVFAAVREAAKRTLGQRHFDVQLLGGAVLDSGKIAEMRTGEGKTLTATLAVYANALSGNGVHVVTVNDFLARRDTVWMGRVYHALGLSVGCIQHDAAFSFVPDQSVDPEDIEKHLKPVSRKEAYAADITYGTNNEFGFDFLRDNMVDRLNERVQRGHAFAVVDEVDSILIDEARTPLIISAPAEQPAEQYYQFAKLVAGLGADDFNVDEKMRAATLTEKGIDGIEKTLGVANIYEKRGIETVHHLEQALKARTLFQKDRDYVVKDGEIVIVDEFTGRMMLGRRYSEGLHQAIEAKEGVQIKQESVTMATVTFQNYFRLYKKLSGMTGTAATEAEEFSKIYNLDVVIVPTNRPMVRKDSGDRVYANERAKFTAIIERVRELHTRGQPILLGTISIEKNELLSELLRDAGLTHEILNAKNHEREAEIIAQAGRKGAITLATNIAGRGVDIILGGKPFDEQNATEVKAQGGLFVLGTERHESRRIDNQLRGRAGRQGDPGETQFFASFDDDLMRIFGSNRMKTMMERLKLPEDTPIENPLVTKAIESAQHRVEGHNFDIRKHLLEYDDVINKHREVTYRRRKEVLESIENEGRGRPLIEQYLEDELEQIVSFHTNSEQESTWELNAIYDAAHAVFPVKETDRKKLEELRETAGDTASDVRARNAIVAYLVTLMKKAYDNFELRVGGGDMLKEVERMVLLRSIDNLWVEHLDQMDHLRRGIGLRGYGQRDPLIEYKKEAFEMFHQLQRDIHHQVASTIFKIGGVRPTQSRRRIQARPVSEGQSAFANVLADDPQSVVTAAPKNTTTPDGKRIGRNDPCFCGSGKKFKKCHGKVT